MSLGSYGIVASPLASTDFMFSRVIALLSSSIVSPIYWEMEVLVCGSRVVPSATVVSEMERWPCLELQTVLTACNI